MISILLSATTHIPLLSTQNKSSGRLQYQMSIENKTPYAFVLKEYDAHDNLIISHTIKPYITSNEYFFKKCKRLELCMTENTYATSLPLNMHQHRLTIIQDPHIKMTTH